MPNESIGLACNFYRESNALPGLLENAAGFFDDLLFVSSPPPGAKPDEESIEIIRKWGARIEFSDISKGFGVVRTECIHLSTTEWVFLADCDERFLHTTQVLHCEGSDQFPHVMNPQLKVHVHDPVYAQGKLLRSVINGAGEDYDAVRTCRRAWMDFTMRKPAQNWHNVQDWQCRILRNRQYLGYDPNVKIHERVRDFRGDGAPKMYCCDDTSRGLFHDHFSNWFRPMEPEQNTEDIAIYNSLEAGVADRMWISHQPKA